MVRHAATAGLLAAHRQTHDHHSGTAISFYASPEEFISMARAAGLETVRYWQGEYPKTRNNYLLRKPAASAVVMQAS
ncbi:MAG TPA: hypothetical protein VI386_32215 [Candidatus Sulfotelmatobacter sp.]